MSDFESKTIIYGCSVVEHEWGMRPDGCIIAKTRDDLNAQMKKTNSIRWVEGYLSCGDVQVLEAKPEGILALANKSVVRSSSDLSVYGTKL